MNLRMLRLFLMLPIVLLLLAPTAHGMNLLRKFSWTKEKVKEEEIKEEKEIKKIPIVYHQNYNINTYGLETWSYSYETRPFDVQKYGKIYNYLVESVNIDQDSFYKPEEISKNDLLKVHSEKYLELLKISKTVADIIKIPNMEYFFSYLKSSSFILAPLRYETGGTLLAAKLVLEKRNTWAINLGGGFPHAPHEQLEDIGNGFCFFNDIALAAKSFPDERCLIVDLGALQGNGYARICNEDNNILIFDVYNKDIEGQDIEARKYIDFHHPVSGNIKTKKYLKLLKKELPIAIEKANPTFIIYIASTDILEEDPIGKMGITKEGIIERDKFVFSCALEKKIPIVMVLGGGYTEKGTEIICKSLENIMKNVVKIVE